MSGPASIGLSGFIGSAVQGRLYSDRASSTTFYRPQLDSLRFLAFFLVFLLHALEHDDVFYSSVGVPWFLSGTIVSVSMAGLFGLDLFFALSAYLITELLLREKAQCSSVDVRAFYTRRVLRIWPLYFTFLFLVFGAQFVLPAPALEWRALAAFSFLAGNWWVVLHGYPNALMFPLWSISVEEQFYLIWPPVVRRLSERSLLWVAIALIFIANSTRLFLCFSWTSELQFWCNTFARLDPIAVGILIALFCRGEMPKLGFSPRVLFVAGLSCFLVCGSFYQYMGVVPRVMIGYPVVALGAGLMLVAVLAGPVLPDGRVMLYLGRISYGLYVFHLLGIMIARNVIPYRATAGSFGKFLMIIAAGFVCTVLLATISYYVLEKPFLAMKRRFTYVSSAP